MVKLGHKNNSNRIDTHRTTLKDHKNCTFSIVIFEIKSGEGRQ